MRELLTIEYVMEAGGHRKVEYERTEFEAEETAGGETEWRFVGGEPLRELRINGEPVTAVSLARAFEGP